MLKKKQQKQGTDLAIYTKNSQVANTTSKVKQLADGSSSVTQTGLWTRKHTVS